MVYLHMKIIITAKPTTKKKHQNTINNNNSCTSTCHQIHINHSHYHVFNEDMD